MHPPAQGIVAMTIESNRFRVFMTFPLARDD
jgi:hypothetical protein